ncbi:hypothetical protein NW759_006855 [Fusarium solani]|nr:hypothetical protein NW759_006855 [Fusarium solani]
MLSHKFLVVITAMSLAAGSSAGPCIPQASLTTETATTSATETSLTTISSAETASTTETIISSTVETASTTEAVTSFSTTETPSTTAAPTSTTTTEEEIVITMAKRSFQDGPPLRKNVHCEVNGSRKAILSLDQFNEERPGIPISIEGCYQRCKDTSPSCKSFSFSYGHLGQPLCDLFDGSVSESVSTLDHAEVSLWFDVVCGSPSEKAWEPSDA